MALEWEIERDAYMESEVAVLVGYCPKISGGIDLVDIFLTARIYKDFDDNSKWQLNLRQSAYLDGNGTEYHYGDFDFDHIKFNTPEDAKNTAEILSSVLSVMLRFECQPTGNED